MAKGIDYTLDNILFEQYKEGIDKIGPEHIISSSDAGQVRWPEWNNGAPTGKAVPAKSVHECWQAFIQELEGFGLSRDGNALRQMVSENPKHLLGITW